MQRFATHVIVFATLLALLPAAARAGLVVDHPPWPTGGLVSDLSFLTIGGNEFSQRLADDFVLAQDTTIAHVVWWGFYGSTFAPENEPPPDSESMRIRFYEDTSEGVPGALIAEEVIDNPQRVATGRQVSTGTSPDEFQYDATLQDPVALSSGVRHWIEIVQVGVLDSLFRWEVSIAELNGHVAINPSVPDWTERGIGDTAFQLYAVPEPSMLGILTLVLVMIRRRNTKR